MSDELGPVGYHENQQEVFLGHSVTQSQNVSEATAQKIDQEIRRIVDTGYAEARRVLTENRDQLERVAEALLEYEALTGDDIDLIMRGEPLPERQAETAPQPTPPAGKRGSVPTTSRPRPSTGPAPSPQPGS